MPHAILIPAITYAAPALLTAGGAYGIASKQAGAQKKAAASQQAANDAALQFEQKKYADSQAREQRAWDDYQARRAQYDAGKSAILARYGINTGGSSGGAGGITIPGVAGRNPQLSAGSGSGGQSTPSMAPAGGDSGGGGAAPFGMDPMAAMGEDPMAGGGAPMEEVDDQLQGASNWSDWGNYGVR